MQQNRTKQIILLIVITLGVIIGFVLIQALNRLGKKSVEIVVAPRIATIKIDNQSVGQGTVYLKEGEHTLLVSSDGFSTVSKKFTVPTTIPITALLTPKTTAAQQYASTHQAEFLKVEGVVGNSSDQAGQQYLKENPILGFLPYKSPLFNIDYGNAANGDLRLYISASTPVGRQVAIAEIRKWGFDPTNYDITFTNFTNPFSGTTGGQQ